MSKIIKFLNSDNFDKLCFYACLVDLMFFPYFFLVSTNYSILILALWFIFRFKKIEFKPNLLLIILMILLIILSTTTSILIYPKYIGGINIYVYNIKIVLQFMSYFLYYLMFANYIKNNSINIKKLLFGLFIFSTILAIIYFINKNIFANIKIFWNSADSYTLLFLNKPNYLQYRYGFIWTDPNNPGYFFVSLFLFMCINMRTNYKEKVFLFVCMLIIVLATMSSGAFLSLVITLAVLLFDFIRKNRKKILQMINLKNVIIIFALMFILIYLFLNTTVFEESIDRIFGNSASPRFNIWSRILKNTNLFRYLVVGTGGTQVILNDLSLIFPHSGELYLLYSFGLPCMLIFIYTFFRPNFNENYKKYLFIIPIVIGFSINTIVGEQKMIVLYLFMFCYYMYGNKKNVPALKTYQNFNDDLVSIIVPIYNSEKYLNRCIDSLINQTYHNIEIILINDGSKDKSLKICKKYAKVDDRIKVFNNKNHGVSYTRNFGIEKANGKYIMFVDSDDYIESHMINDMLSLEEPGVDLVISSLVMKNKNKQIISMHSLKNATYKFNDFIESINKDVDFLCVCGPCCKLYNLEKIKSNNIKFNEELSMGEDTTFNVDYLYYTNKIVTMNNTYYNYMRENPDSLFTRYYNNFMILNENVLNYFLEMLKKRNCSEMGILNLETIYFTIIFSSNNMNFKYHNLSTKEKRISDIEYMYELPIIKRMVNQKPSGMSQKIKFFLIRKKQTKILYWLFTLNNLIKEC